MQLNFAMKLLMKILFNFARKDEGAMGIVLLTYLKAFALAFHVQRFYKQRAHGSITPNKQSDSYHSK